MAIPREEFMKHATLSYIAGFLDGDGCINAQIVTRADYVLGFQVRVSVSFAQKTKRHWYLLWLKKQLPGGVLRRRKDGMSDYTFTGAAQVKTLLRALRPQLIIKRRQALVVLRIIEDLPTTKDPAAFLAVCEMVDHLADLNDSKKRVITRAYVIHKWAEAKAIDSP